jgi:hypothetical protein
MRMGAGPDSWEVWTIVPAANGKFGLLNEQFKKYASARQDHTCTPMGVLDSWEMFYTAHGKNGIEFRTEHKSNLSSDGTGVHCSPNSVRTDARPPFPYHLLRWAVLCCAGPCVC